MSKLDEIKARVAGAKELPWHVDHGNFREHAEEDIRLLIRALELAAWETVDYLGIPDPSAAPETVKETLIYWLEQATADLDHPGDA